MERRLLLSVRLGLPPIPLSKYRPSVLFLSVGAGRQVGGRGKGGGGGADHCEALTFAYTKEDPPENHLQIKSKK